MPFDLNDDQVNQLRNGGWLRPDQGINPAASAPASPQDAETTSVPPALQNKFQQWLQDNKVTDYGNPNSFYDYGGAFLGGVSRDKEDGHFPDTYKQHGHPTFSVESQYSAGPNDGGHWDGDKFVPPQQAKTDAVKPIDAGTTTIVGDPGKSAMPPKDLGFMDESKRYEQSQLGTLQGRQDLVAEGAARQASIIDQMAAEQERSAKEFQADNQREVELSNYARSHATTMYDGLRSQVKTAMAQQIDPNRFFNTRSPLLAIGAAISAGLGAYGAAINHTPNFALDIINRAIDRDNESQIKGIENQWKGISANIDIADRDAAADKYKVEQFNRLKVQKLEASKALVASYASRSDSETVKNNAAMLINGIDGYINATIHQGTLERRAFLQQQQASAFAAQQNQLKLAREDAKSFAEAKAGYINTGHFTEEQAAAMAAKDHPLGFSFLRQAGNGTYGGGIPLVNDKPGNEKPEKPDQAHEDKVKETTVAFDEADRLYNSLTDAFKSGDKGKYEQARSALQELMPKLYGFTRGPSEGQLGGGGGKDDERLGTIGGQIPEYNKYYYLPGAQTVIGHATLPPGANPYYNDVSKIRAFGAHLQNLRQGTLGTPSKAVIEVSPQEVGAVKPPKPPVAPTPYDNLGGGL